MTKGAKIGIVAVLVVTLAAGVIIYKNKKKKKELQTGDEPATDAQGGQSAGFWSGLTQAQTKELQSRLNEFASSGLLGEILGYVLGEIQGYAYIFVRNTSGKVEYNYYSPSQQRWLGWCSYWSFAPNDGGNKAYAKWLEDGEPSGAYYDSKGNAVTDGIPSPLPPSSADWDQLKMNTDNAMRQSAALQRFRESVSSVINEGGLKVDGQYGPKTMSVVTALQIYLNAEHGANLTVDGKYGSKTDSATGWGILNK